MTTGRRRRVAGALALAACALVASPSTAAPPVVMVGPSASGWVVTFHPKTKAVDLHLVAMQPAGDRSLRVVRETCGDPCVADDLIVPGTMEWRSSELVVRMTHPALGAVVLVGALGPASPGQSSTCFLGWKGSLTRMEANAADFHEVHWSGRMGPLRVRNFTPDACGDFAHLAGTLVVS